MNLKKESLETVIARAIESGLSSSHVLSDKARKRIEKSAEKLGEKLAELFEKEEKRTLEKSEGQVKDRKKTKKKSAGISDQDIQDQ